jgi:hypothetical protein
LRAFGWTTGTRITTTIYTNVTLGCHIQKWRSRIKELKVDHGCLVLKLLDIMKSISGKENQAMWVSLLESFWLDYRSNDIITSFSTIDVLLLPFSRLGWQ